MEAIFRAEAWGHMCEPISRGNEAAVCSSMAAGCEGALQRYRTTLADDIKALDACDASTSAEMRMALRVRMVRFPLSSA